MQTDLCLRPYLLGKENTKTNLKTRNIKTFGKRPQYVPCKNDIIFSVGVLNHRKTKSIKQLIKVGYQHVKPPQQAKRVYTLAHSRTYTQPGRGRDFHVISMGMQSAAKPAAFVETIGSAIPKR